MQSRRVWKHIRRALPFILIPLAIFCLIGRPAPNTVTPASPAPAPSAILLSLLLSPSDETDTAEENDTTDDHFNHDEDDEDFSSSNFDDGFNRDLDDEDNDYTDFADDFLKDFLEDEDLADDDEAGDDFLTSDLLDVAFQNDSTVAARVYITRTGACYHRPRCHSLRFSAIPTTARMAFSLGLRPCRICRPPLPDLRK
ncbi:MAG: hypothetical protein RMJ43_02740 [Chloroherpetonaceae bacterium]|nr:hypothetical protein [Chthonomonadaceae bacterium]MDW8206728.1 hypothetical protein [Chloroherpetonaceae bacterium]